ncbi:MAG: hypothetical protein JW990_22405 [Thermoleophilia bacterium]|nr:hypothetical protein [Thermoleophilia bacterium]
MSDGSTLLRRKVGEEGVDLRFTHVGQVAYVVECIQVLVCLLGASCVLGDVPMFLDELAGRNEPLTPAG